MLSATKHLTRGCLFGCALLLSLLLTGCGGGGDDSSSSPSTPEVLAPKNLVGAVILVTYSDSRSFTFTVNSSVSPGLTRNDGKTITNWSADGYGSPYLRLNVYYGDYTSESPENRDNVFDEYIMNFDSKTEGGVVIRENVTINSYGNVAPITGSVKFTTYPPSG